jgi:hypothetical protein
VIDATGTYGKPNWIGMGGIPAHGAHSCKDPTVVPWWQMRLKGDCLQKTGEEGLRKEIWYTVPDTAGPDGAIFAGEKGGLSASGTGNVARVKQRASRITAVIGTGASAATVLKGLQAVGEIAEDGEQQTSAIPCTAPTYFLSPYILSPYILTGGISRPFLPGAGVEVVWIGRRGINPYTMVENDPLPQRDELFSFANSLSQGRPTGTKNFVVQYLAHTDILGVVKVADFVDPTQTKYLAIICVLGNLIQCGRYWFTS